MEEQKMIAVTYGENDNPFVSGRELHGKLEIKTAYKDWFPRMCDYGFDEWKDFNPLKIERVETEGDRQVMREVTDHMITIDMAKQICMIQRTEVGRRFREYFLEIERQWNSEEAVTARALMFSQKRISGLLDRCKSLETKIEKDAPKVLFASAVEASSTSILIGDLAKLLKQNGVEIGQNRLFEKLRDDGYLIKHGSSRNLPTQRSMERKLFEIKESTIQNPDGSVRVTRTTKVTGKGQTYFVNRYISDNISDTEISETTR